MKKLIYSMLIFSMLSEAQVNRGQFRGNIQALRAQSNHSEVAKKVCKKYADRKDRLALKACNNAERAAKAMAKKFASKAGEFLGCVDGYSQGFHDGYVYTKDPTNYQMQEAQRFASNAAMQSAKDRAVNQASRVGESAATDHVIKAFRRASQTRVEPRADYQYPRVNFQGFDEGYMHDHASEYDDLIHDGTLRSSDPFERRVEARVIREVSRRAEYRAERICDHRGTVFESQGGLDLWRYHRSEREMDFAKYAWDNPNAILDKFLRGRHPLADEYSAMKTWKVKVKSQSSSGSNVDKPKIEVPKTGKIKVPQSNKDKVSSKGSFKKDKLQKLPSSGKKTKIDTKPSKVVSTGKLEINPDVLKNKKDKMTERVVNSEELKKLQEAYKVSFKQAYKRFHAPNFASKTYSSSGARIYPAAVVTGQMVGEDVAQIKAEKYHYDRKYKNLSQKVYSQVVKSQYKKEYDIVFDRFENSSVVELNSFSIKEQDVDGIFRPIEKLKAQISATNLGLVSGQVQARMSGQGINPLGSSTLTVPKLSSINQETSYIGQIDSRMKPDSYAEVLLSLQGNLDVSDLVVTSDVQVIDINEIAEIVSVTPKISSLDGAGGVLVEIENPSTKSTTAMVEVIVHVQGKKYSAETEELDGGEVRVVNVEISELDILSTINSRSLNIIAEVAINGKVLDSSRKSQSTGNQTNNIVEYFGRLASNPTLKMREDLKRDLKSVSRKLLGQLDQEIAYKLNWKKQREVDASILRKIQIQYQGLKISGKMTKSTQDVFSKLSKEMVKEMNRIKGFLWVKKQRRKAFVKELQKIDPSMNYDLAKKLAD